MFARLLRGLFYLLLLFSAGLGAQSYTVSLSSLQSVHVSLDEDCSATIGVQQLLLGNFGGAPDSEFSISILDDNSSNGPVVDGCGVFTYQVVASSNIIGFTTAWGTVIAEDKRAPVLVQLPVAPAPLFCTSVATVNVNNLAANISRCWQQSGQSPLTLNNSLHPELEARLMAAGGLPNFSDGCSAVTICVNDQLLENDACGNTLLRRTFTARDGDCTSVAGAENPPAIAAYDILFSRPNLADVLGVEPTLALDCGQFNPADPNPAPAISDFPFVLDAAGFPVYLDANFCQLSAAYTDGPRVVTCPETYKFTRTFTVIDWCQPTSPPRIFTQLVKVGDFDPPSISPPTQDLDFDGFADEGPLRFSATTTGCSGLFVIPAPPVSDNCSAFQVQAFIYLNGLAESTPLGPYPLSAVAVASVPLGAHLLRYIATDACGNQTSLDVPILVEDGTAPSAICENDLHISLGTQGIATVLASSLNAASSDHCGPVSFRLARLGNNNVALSPYATSLVVSCEDLGNLRLGLEVRDAVGNLNFCWLDVLVEDKLRPICTPPPSYALECSDLQGSFPANVQRFFEQDPSAAAALLNTQFGSASATDNCLGSQITQSVFDGRNSCGIGSIQRRFTSTDAQGLVNNINCQQFLAIGARHDYSIMLPADAEASDCVAPDYMGLTTQTTACDLLNIATRVDTFLSLAAECYKLRFTYDVINWCEYNGTSTPYIIPRDANANNVVGEASWLHITPGSGPGLQNDIAFLDRDADRDNQNSITNLDTGDGGILAGSHPGGYGVDGSRGAFRYQQFVKVFDNTPPTLLLPQPEQPGLALDDSCLGSISLPFRVDDLCSPGSVNFSAQLDIFIADSNGDGIFTLAEFVPIRNVSSAITPDTTAGDFTIWLTELPIGQHAVRLVASDGCGNIQVGLVRFSIIDRKAPTPICINGLTATLLPDEAGGGQAAIQVSDFLASTTSDCSGPVRYAIYRETDTSLAAFTPSVQDTSLLLSCADDSLLLLRIYAIDAAGNYDYCQTNLQVQQHDSQPCTPPSAGTLSGQILTLDDEAISGVTVYITGETEQIASTDALGVFTFQELPFGEDYTLLPYADSDHINGVSTFDILAISRHILGLFSFTDPYQYIAADANRSQEITVRDLIVIRRVILGLDDNFDNNTSWRFVEAGYTFPEADNPWAEIFPEVANFNNFAFSQLADFTAVKVGDINRDADPQRMLQTGNAQEAVRGRSATAMLEARLLSPTTARESNIGAQMYVGTPWLSPPYGHAVQEQSQYKWAVYAKDSNLLGLQATWSLAEGMSLVEISDGQLRQSEHFGLRFIDRGWITMSYQQSTNPLSTDLPLFYITLAQSSASPEKSPLRLGSQHTTAEAYPEGGDIIGLDLQYAQESSVPSLTAAANHLYQNTPNPFKEQTAVTYTATASGPASLLIYDSQGRLVAEIQQDAQKGHNTLLLQRQQLPAAGGLYTYTLQLDHFSASRRMLVLD